MAQNEQGAGLFGSAGENLRLCGNKKQLSAIKTPQHPRQLQGQWSRGIAPMTDAQIARLFGLTLGGLYAAVLVLNALAY